MPKAGWSRYASSSFGTRLTLVALALVLLNGGAWLWALLAFRGAPTLFGVALVVYGLGLRHAVDADHIAAIDNATRKLVEDGRRPAAVGLFFALGHSAVVVIVAALAASSATLFGGTDRLREVGAVVGTCVSTLFLFAIAAMNIVILVSIYRNYRRVRRGAAFDDDSLRALLGGTGRLARARRALFGLVTRSWHMLPLGFLFGLGFDTATEVAVFGVAAVQSAKGIPLTTVLVFPVLFAAAMSLVDTCDGVAMVRAYDWMMIRPIRRLYYNMAVTAVSVVVALVIGGVELLGLVAERFDLKNGVWRAAAVANDNFSTIGLAIIGLFAVSWLLSYVIYRLREFEGAETV